MAYRSLKNRAITASLVRVRVYALRVFDAYVVIEQERQSRPEMDVYRLYDIRSLSRLSRGIARTIFVKLVCSHGLEKLTYLLKIFLSRDH